MINRKGSSGTGCINKGRQSKFLCVAVVKYKAINGVDVFLGQIKQFADGAIVQRDGDNDVLPVPITPKTGILVVT